MSFFAHFVPAEPKEKDAKLTPDGQAWAYIGGALSARRVKNGETSLPYLCITSPLNRAASTCFAALQALQAEGYELPPTLVLSQAVEEAGSYASTVEEKAFSCPWISGHASQDRDDGGWNDIWEYWTKEDRKWREPLHERAEELNETLTYLSNGIYKRTGKGEGI